MSGGGRSADLEPVSGASATLPGILANVAIRVAVVLAVVFSFWTRPLADADVWRFSELGTASGTPYRDYAVEYAPGELVFIRLIGTADFRATAVRLVLACFLLDLVAFAGLWRGWGSTVAVSYLWLGLPLLSLRYLRLWYLPVAVLVWAFVFLRRRRPEVGGLLAALAVFVKLWPLALAPVVWSEARRRSLTFVAGLVGGTLLWLRIGGFEGIREVVSFRSATGWEIESTVGALVWIVGGGRPGWEAGAVRVGSTHGLTWIPAVLLLGLLAAIWARAGRWPGDPLGVPSTVALCAVLACSPLFSLQYAGWLTPWAAIASREPDRVPTVASWGIVLLTAGVGIAMFRGRVDLDGPDAIVGQAMLLLRNAVCLGLPLWFVARAGARDAAEPELVRPA